MNNAGSNKDVQISVGVPVFNSFGSISRGGIAGAYGNFIFKFFLCFFI